MNLKKFSKNELANILSIIQDAITCQDEAEIIGLLEKTKEIVCADYSICGIGKGDSNSLSKAGPPKIINNNYPMEWLKVYAESNLFYVDPIIWHNFQSPGAQLWTETYKKYGEKVSQDFIGKSNDFGICYGASGGIYDKLTEVSTIFTFSSSRNRFEQHHKEILSIVAPHLHQAFLRIVKQSHIDLLGSLSEREKEIINWMKEGKTNWEISIILNISENTVKFHIKNIEYKLSAVNKAHAIAIFCDQAQAIQ
jgi:DNA-binding CsgD family transcriptional regulator